MENIQVRLMISAGIAEFETFSLPANSTLGVLIDEYQKRYFRPIDVDAFVFRCRGETLGMQSRLFAGDLITACPRKPDGE